MTTVVNIKRLPLHDQFDMRPGDVYIGRAGHGKTGTFGNPFVVGKMCSRCHRYHATRESTLPCYEAYLNERAEKDSNFRAELLNLRNKRLGCFCKPDACHGDVIVRWLERNPS